MRQQTSILPVRCAGCGTVFDLWYDLQKAEEGYEERELSKEVRQSLCWNCRQTAIEEMHDEETDLEETLALSSTLELE